MKSAFSKATGQKNIISTFDIDSANKELIKRINPLIQLIKETHDKCDQAILTRKLFFTIYNNNVPDHYKYIYIAMANMIRMYSTVEQKSTSCIIYSIIRPRY